MRIGIAIEAPETSAFFNEARRLVIGTKNTLSTIYSSAEVAARSRLRLPDGYSATAVPKSPNEIDYEISVPADALHGDFANLAIEADGVALGRARVQLLRPASIRLTQGLQFHFGPVTEMTPDPPVVALDPRGGANLEIAIRNNSMQIQTYHLQAAGEGLEFLPPKVEVSIAPTDERRVELRVFAGEGVTGLREWTLNVKGGAEVAMPMRLMLTPRGAHGGVDRGPGRRWRGRVDFGIGEGARSLLDSGWRALDGIHVEGYEHQFSCPRAAWFAPGGGGVWAGGGSVWAGRRRGSARGGRRARVYRQELEAHGHVDRRRAHY